ncbi:MAG TPA: ankyrin repeat domain-containing protein, partial [Candidatus Rifleibacterium sp.]|nr:ankyrin repeat domain-containing protein [Candidatus Rifleibacterium sp.]
MKNKIFCSVLLFILLTLANSRCFAEKILETYDYDRAKELFLLMNAQKEKTPLEALKRLLKNATPAEINDLRLTDGKYSLLTLVIESTKNPEIIKYLIKKGADVNFPRRLYYTPLFAALMHGNLEIAEILVRAGADVNCSDNYDTMLTKFIGWHDLWPGTAAFGSVDKARKATVEFLLRHGADVKARIPEDNATTLMRAVACNYPEVLDILIEHGANVNETNDLGETALFLAAENNNSDETIRRLIKLGADVNARDANGTTPLMSAACSENLEAINTLIECGADVTAKDNDGMNAVIYACACACDYKGLPGEHLNPLFANGIDINERDSEGLTAYYYTMSNEYTIDASLYMIKMGADTNIRLRHNMTPLMVSAGRGDMFSSRFPEKYINELSALIERASDLNLQDDEGKTALMWAVLGFGEPSRGANTRQTVEKIVPM